jgi:molybdate transport system substrate-binding protein
MPRTWIAALVLLAGGRQLSADELMVFAASSLTEALQDVGQEFETASGHKVSFNLGASSDLARQIQAGAAADVFFSADQAQMDKLQQAGRVRAEDRVDLLSNVLVVVVPAGAKTKLKRAADLVRVRHLALADPEAVPAGVYARTWLEAIGLWAKVQERVVPTLNVRAALAAVESGDADAGIVYRTDAVVTRRATVAFEVPRGEGPAIVYPVASLASAPKTAGDFVRYLAGPQARAIFRRRGFIVLAEK